MSLPFYNMLGIKRAAPLYPKNTKPVFRFCYAGLVVDTYPHQGAVAPHANYMRDLLAGHLSVMWDLTCLSTDATPSRVVWIEINGSPLALATQDTPGVFKDIVAFDGEYKYIDPLIRALVLENNYVRPHVGPEHICLNTAITPMFEWTEGSWLCRVIAHFDGLGFVWNAFVKDRVCTCCKSWIRGGFDIHMTRRSDIRGYELLR